MATSKLLKPTNVTISIPEFTDQPDQRVNSNCIDKSADAINTLSEHIGKNNVKTLTPGTNVTAYENATIATENPYSKIAFVNLYLTASASIGAGNILCSGLPIPSKVVFGMAADYDGNNTYTTVPCYINTNGYFISRATFTNGHTILVTMMYVIA